MVPSNNSIKPIFFIKLALLLRKDYDVADKVYYINLNLHLNWNFKYKNVY